MARKECRWGGGGPDVQTVEFAIRLTGGCGSPKTIEIGQLTFDEPSVYHLILGAADLDTRQAVNVWQLQLVPRP
jgi:hypothetical protein